MHVDWRFLCGCRWEFESKEGSSHNVTECTPVVSSKVMNRGTCHPRDWRCWGSWFYIFNFLSMALFWELVMLMLYIHVHRIRQSLIVSCTFLCPFTHISLTFQGYKLWNSMSTFIMETCMCVFVYKNYIWWKTWRWWWGYPLSPHPIVDHSAPFLTPVDKTIDFFS